MDGMDGIDEMDFERNIKNGADCTSPIPEETLMTCCIISSMTFRTTNEKTPSSTTT